MSNYKLNVQVADEIGWTIGEYRIIKLKDRLLLVDGAGNACGWYNPAKLIKQAMGLPFPDDCRRTIETQFCYKQHRVSVYAQHTPMGCGPLLETGWVPDANLSEAITTAFLAATKAAEK